MSKTNCFSRASAVDADHCERGRPNGVTSLGQSLVPAR
jgi:hypothetical protein